MGSSGNSLGGASTQQLHEQLQQKDREISDLRQKQAQLQQLATAATPAPTPMGFPGLPGSNRPGGSGPGQQQLPEKAKQEIAGLKQTISDLTTQNSTLSSQVQQVELSCCNRWNGPGQRQGACQYEAIL